MIYFNFIPVLISCVGYVDFHIMILDAVITTHISHTLYMHRYGLIIPSKKTTCKPMMKKPAVFGDDSSDDEVILSS